MPHHEERKVWPDCLEQDFHILVHYWHRGVTPRPRRVAEAPQIDQVNLEVVLRNELSKLLLGK